MVELKDMVPLGRLECRAHEDRSLGADLARQRLHQGRGRGQVLGQHGRHDAIEGAAVARAVWADCVLHLKLDAVAQAADLQ